MPDFLRPIKYFDDGYTYFVSQGIGSGDLSPWFTVRVMSGKTGMHRVCSPALPKRRFQEAAQADLDGYAMKKGFKLIDSETTEG